MNFHALPREKKAAMKDVAAVVRKQLYGPTNNKALLQEGLVINYGKGTEERLTVKVQVVG